MTRHEIEQVLDKLSEGFMGPQITGPMAVISYEDRYEGTVYLPAEYEGDVPTEARDTIERHEGKYLACLSAPGYMDRTDVTMHDSLDEAEAHLAETYGDDIDLEDDEDRCPECARSYGPHYDGPCEH